MLNRFIRTAHDYANHTAGKSAAWAVFARDTLNGFVTTAHHALMILGLSAIAVLVLMFVKPDIADQLKALSPFTAAIAQEPEAAAQQFPNLMDASVQAQQPVPKELNWLSKEEQKLAGASREQQWVTNWLSKRYRVAGDATNMLVSAAYLTAQEIKIDPLLILAVMAIESGFNPFAESAVGAQGLMQVMSKLHHEKFQDLGGIKSALNPVANIKVGSLILKDYVARGGSLEAGLKMYVGAAAFENDSGYGSRVLAEYRRLKEVAAGKNVPIFSTTASTAPPKPAPLDPSIETKPDAAPEPDSASVSPQYPPRVKASQVAAL